MRPVKVGNRWFEHLVDSLDPLDDLAIRCWQALVHDSSPLPSSRTRRCLNVTQWAVLKGAFIAGDGTVLAPLSSGVALRDARRTHYGIKPARSSRIRDPAPQIAVHRKVAETRAALSDMRSRATTATDTNLFVIHFKPGSSAGADAPLETAIQCRRKTNVPPRSAH